MPFIVTTKRPDDAFNTAEIGEGSLSALQASGEDPYVSRRAFATLDQARQSIRNFMDETFVYGRRYHADADEFVTESGGTVGPLPDGTTILVEPVSQVEREQFAIRAMLSPRTTDEEWCAAYNAAQETRR